MACLPGNVFVLGSNSYTELETTTEVFASPEHLVQLSPFALDLDEVSVGTIRQLVMTQGLPPPATGDTESGETPPECTYYTGDDDPTKDAYPVNCIPWASAAQACQLLGKRLPTEAEWEYAAGNLGLRTSFPWGGDTDVCSHAVIADGRGSDPYESTECLAVGATPGPQPSGRTVDDATTLQILNLGGDLSEWTSDIYQPYTGDCWQTGANLLVDPSCSASGLHTVRGGYWAGDTDSAYIYYRFAPGEGASTYNGFRCAMSM